MARPPKRRQQLNRGPFSSSDVVAALRRVGWKRTPGAGKHLQYEHPDFPGRKVFISKGGFAAVKPGTVLFNSIGRQAGYGKDGLLRLLNGLDPDG